MLDVSVLMKQHAQINERFTTLEAMAHKHATGTVGGPSPNITTSVFGMLIVSPLVTQNDCMVSSSCCSPCAEGDSSATSSA